MIATTRAHAIASELRALAAHGDHGGRYQQAERELCNEICTSRWMPSRGAYVVAYRLPTGHAVRDARRAVAAWVAS